MAGDAEGVAVRDGRRDHGDRALVRQFLLTDSLLGVSFVPVQRPVNRLEQLRAAYMAGPGGDLRREGLRPVFGTDGSAPLVLFVRDQPSPEEQACGRAGEGPSGKKVMDMVRAMGLGTDEVRLTHLVRVRRGSEAVSMEDAERDGPWVRREIDLLEPLCVVAMGPVSTSVLTGTRGSADPSMEGIRGVMQRTVCNGRDIPLMPVIDPEYLLAHYTTEVRKQLWTDLQRVMSVVGDESSGR